jgi:hypothetical protein
MRGLLRLVVVVGVGVGVVLGLAGNSDAQYFGQNRVQYRNFKFRVLKTQHFDIYYYPETEDAIDMVGRMAERWYVRLSQLLDYQFEDRQPVILYASHPDFEQTNALQGEQPGEGTGGVTESFKRRVVLPFAGGMAETDHVLGHELVHAFQYAETGQHSEGPMADAAALRLPLWFIEGMAEYLSVGPVDPQTAMWMRDAVRSDKIPTIKDLSSPQYFPYRWGQALWAYIAGRWGDPVVGKILKAAGRHASAEYGIRAVLGIGVDELTQEWHKALKDAYEPLVKQAASETPLGKRILGGTKKGARLYVGPSLSPDGSQVIFLSERGQFAIDLFVANAASGQVEAKLSSAETDPHMDSLQFINSAGAWAPDGKRFAYAAVVQGSPALTVVNVKKEKDVREIRLPSLGEISTPSWSPDEKRVAFTALVGGVQDLFMYDLETDHLERLTHDAYADLGPAWSPDGKLIAFATDRFSSNLKELQFGNYRLATIDPETKAIEELPSFAGVKNVNPQWSPDGKSVYFISDREGVSNIYRLNRDTQQVYQLTDLLTGVSGITALSPALSTSSSSNHLAYSLFQDVQYSIYSVDDAEQLQGKLVQPKPGEVDYARLPPVERSNDMVAALKNDPAYGLPDASKFMEKPYHSRLSLDYVSQPYIVAGTDRFGSFAGGGTGLLFSDMLGNHTVSATFQINGRLNDASGILAYQNLTHRFNWAIAGGQVPYRYGNYYTLYDPSSGLYQDVAAILRQVNREANVIGAYPFSRASRVEAFAGYRNVIFEQELDTTYYDGVTGQIIDANRQVSRIGDPLNLGEGSLAYVYDNSLFGATSPILGRRARVELGGVGGTLSYMTALGDFREYWMIHRPFTVAARLLHYGRYGVKSTETRLNPIYLGYPGLVRGYDVDTYSVAECGDVPGKCPAFDNTAGEQVIVANAELRFPLFGIFGGSSYYGPFPIEAAVFYDAGWAWSENEGIRPKFLGGDRPGVRSYGGALRINVLGFALVEIDYVKPINRPVKGAHWEFSFAPGF